MSLARSACDSNCPIHALTISRDGTVTYTGEAFVKVKGPASTQVSVSGVPCARRSHELEEAIDALAGSEQWVRCDTEGGACCDPECGNPLLFPGNR